MSRPFGGRARGTGDRGGKGNFSRGGRGGGGRGGSAAGPVEVFRDEKVKNLQPSSEVSRIEEAFMKSASDIAGLNLSATMPRRPGYGTQGAPITVWANYFEVTAEKAVTVYTYDVNIEKVGSSPAPSRIKKKRIFTLLLEDPRFSQAMSNFSSMFVSRAQIEGCEVIIDLRGEGEDEPPENPHQYKVTVKETAALPVFELLEWLKSTSAASPEFGSRFDIIAALNNIIGHIPQSNKDVATVAQNKHYALDGPEYQSMVLGGGMAALRGYFKSVRLGTSRFLLNVNVAHGVFYEPLRLDALMRKLGTAKKPNLAKYLKYLRIVVLHIPRKRNKANQGIPVIKTIFDVAQSNDGFNMEHQPQVKGFAAGPKDVKFFLESSRSGPAAKQASKGDSKELTTAGKYISVWDYFLQNYPNHKLDATLPVVNVGNRERPSYLPAEVCGVLPGQPMRRKLLPDETRAMIEFACRKPKENFDSIIRDGRSVLGLNSLGLTRYGLAVSKTLITVPARILAPPNVLYAGSSVVPRTGSWNMEGVKFAKGSNIGQWTYTWIRSDRRTNQGFQTAKELHDTVHKLVTFMNKSGINIGAPLTTPPPPQIGIRDGYEIEAEMAIDNLLGKMGSSPKERKPQFVLVILPFNDASLYRKIKTMGDTKAGIHTICVVGAKFAKINRQEQYFANVALKFNLKAGGINQTLEAPKLGIISDGKTMVVGIDVTHPSPGSKDNAPSVAGIVASVDKSLGQWPAELSVQKGRTEMVGALQTMLKSRLVLWKKHNHAFPDNILVYRDGVSEGQYELILANELPLMRRACAELYPATATKQGIPAISIIIVGKRHHTRFAPTKPDDADRSHNCKNGTIVDRGVTEVRNWDFFLQAHACLQGSARPAHYYVILDEIFRGKKSKNPSHKHAADALEDLTHNMCHLFGRATKAVSICPPAYYADLLCERARCYLGRMFDPPAPTGTPAMSAVSGSEDRDMQDEDVRVHATLKDTMFYI